MAETLPTSTPSAFIAGDRAKWTLKTIVNGDHKDPADSWVLTYALRNADRKIDITGSDNGDGTHLVSVAPTTTADYPAGVYHYQAVITLGTDRYVVDQGQICVEPNFAALDAHDAREWAERVLAALEATLEGKATTDQAAYSIAGRSLSRMTWTELMSARQKLLAEVRSLRSAESVARGGGNMNIIRVRI